MEYIIEYSSLLGIGKISIIANCKKEARDKFWSMFKLQKDIKFLKWIKK